MSSKPIFPASTKPGSFSFGSGSLFKTDSKEENKKNDEKTSLFSNFNQSNSDYERADTKTIDNSLFGKKDDSVFNNKEA